MIIYKKNINRGLFISFEGIDGSGKSTQIKFIAKYLKNQGLDVVLTREPGGTNIAEYIRLFLLKEKLKKIDPYLEYILFNIARINHLYKIIIPSLRSKKIVLCDRFIDSTIVYQEICGKIKKKDFILFKIAGIKKYIMPDLTLIFDISCKTSIKRICNRSLYYKKAINVFEQYNVTMQNIRRKAFLKIAKKENDRCCIINAEKSIKKVFFDIIYIIKNKIHNL